MFRSRVFRVSAISAMLCVAGSGMNLVAADADSDLSLQDEQSVAETGAWSEAAIAKGQNKEIDDKALADLPPSLRQIWASKPEAADRSEKDRRKTMTSKDLVDEIIPAYGVQYITDQRNFSRAEPLWLKVHKFLTNVNIRVMAGELGRRGPMLTNPERSKGEKAVEGDVALQDQGVLPEEAEIAELHQALVELRKQISYPNLLEREHFNEIAGDLAKAQGLLNYDLTEDGIKRIDEQFAAWRVLIEAARLRAIEAHTDAILEENPSWDRSKARRQAERDDITFILPPLPMGEHALRDARAELNRMHEVRSPAKENARQKAREEAAEKEKEPEIVEVEEAESEEAAEEVSEEAAEEVMEEAAEEDAEIVVEDIEIEEAAEEEPEAPMVEKELDVEVEDFEIEEEAPKEEMVKEEAPAEEEEEDSLDLEDDFDFE